jgi:Family of unknown function (DUF5670)
VSHPRQCGQAANFANLQYRLGTSVALVSAVIRGFAADKDGEGGWAMLWTIAVILLVLWAVGLFTAYTAGGLVHLLLAIAVIVVVFQFIGGRRAA